MRYGTSVSAGETGDRTHGFRRGMSPILPPLQPKWTNLLAQVFIYTQEVTPEEVERTHTPELRTVSRERTLGKAISPIYLN